MVCCNVFQAMKINKICLTENEKNVSKITGALVVLKPSSINCNIRSRVKFFRDSSSNFSFAELALKVFGLNLKNRTKQFVVPRFT